MNLNFHQHKLAKPKNNSSSKKQPHPSKPSIFCISLPPPNPFPSSPYQITKGKGPSQHLPSQRKSQPISNPPRDQQHAIRQPDPSRTPTATVVRCIRPRVVRQVDGHQQHDARRQRDGQEHRHEEVRGRRAQREVVAQDEEDDDGDGEEGEEGEDFRGDRGGGGRGRGRGGDGEVHGLLRGRVCSLSKFRVLLSHL